MSPDNGPETRPATERQPPAPRYDERYSHISVSLRYHADDAQWHQLRALGWNAQGFNFYSTQAIALGPLQFKRGLTMFEGNVVWRARNTDADALRAVQVNELLFHKIREMEYRPDLNERLVKLLRAPLLTDEKCLILAALGLDTSDATLARLVARRPYEQAMFRYGVQVDSEAWRQLASNALEMSAVVLALEKVSAALGPS